MTGDWRGERRSCCRASWRTIASRTLAWPTSLSRMARLADVRFTDARLADVRLTDRLLDARLAVDRTAPRVRFAVDRFAAACFPARCFPPARFATSLLLYQFTLVRTPTGPNAGPHARRQPVAARSPASAIQSPAPDARGFRLQAEASEASESAPVASAFRRKEREGIGKCASGFRLQAEGARGRRKVRGRYNPAPATHDQSIGPVPSSY